MEKIVLGKGIVLEDGVGISRPNNNQMVVGCSGTGKSMSVMLPTILNMNESSMIATYAKAGEAVKIGKYLARKGYTVDLCDLTDPSRSTAAFDPLYYVRNRLDVEALAASVVFANPESKNVRDPYWNESAVCLLSALINAELYTNKPAKMSNVLDLFDRLRLTECGRGIQTSLDSFFEDIEYEEPAHPAVANFADFQHLPYNTAGCVRDTLAKAVRKMFPDPIRAAMQNRPPVDFCRLADEKSALIIITSPVNVSLYYFANLIFGTAIKELLEYAERLPEQKLPRQMRLMFDDFACAATVNEFSHYISIFRAAGISAMMLIQSESQLSSLYSEDEATTILNNCSSYVYFPGGMDLSTCKSISQRLDRPLSEIMYAPTGDVIVMCSGKKPVKVPRYEIFESGEYRDFRRITMTRAEKARLKREFTE